MSSSVPRMERSVLTSNDRARIQLRCYYNTSTTHISISVTIDIPDTISGTSSAYVGLHPARRYSVGYSFRILEPLAVHSFGRGHISTTTLLPLRRTPPQVQKEAGIYNIASPLQMLPRSLCAMNITNAGSSNITPILTFTSSCLFLPISLYSHPSQSHWSTSQTTPDYADSYAPSRPLLPHPSRPVPLAPHCPAVHCPGPYLHPAQQHHCLLPPARPRPGNCQTAHCPV